MKVLGSFLFLYISLASLSADEKTEESKWKLFAEAGYGRVWTSIPTSRLYARIFQNTYDDATLFRPQMAYPSLVLPAKTQLQHIVSVWKLGFEYQAFTSLSFNFFLGHTHTQTSSKNQDLKNRYRWISFALWQEETLNNLVRGSNYIDAEFRAIQPFYNVGVGSNWYPLETWTVSPYLGAKLSGGSCTSGRGCNAFLTSLQGGVHKEFSMLDIYMELSAIYVQSSYELFTNRSQGYVFTIGVKSKL
ncbi:MAG: hypothetical protein AAF518_23330 [Spirochaetota bacterium]